MACAACSRASDIRTVANYMWHAVAATTGGTVPPVVGVCGLQVPWTGGE